MAGEKGRAIGKWAALGLVFVLVAYPLLLGPLVYLNLAGQFDQSVIDWLLTTVYAPCMWLIDHNELYERYVYWWIDLGVEEYIRNSENP